MPPQPDPNSILLRPKAGGTQSEVLHVSHIIVAVRALNSLTEDYFQDQNINPNIQLVESTQDDEDVGAVLTYKSLPIDGIGGFAIGRDPVLCDITVGTPRPNSRIGARVGRRHLRIRFNDFGLLEIVDSCRLGTHVKYCVDGDRSGRGQEFVRVGTKQSPCVWALPPRRSVHVEFDGVKIEFWAPRAPAPSSVTLFMQQCSLLARYPEPADDEMTLRGLHHRSLRDQPTHSTLSRPALVQDVLLGQGGNGQVYRYYNASTWAAYAGKTFFRGVDNYAMREIGIMSEHRHRRIVKFVGFIANESNQPVLLVELFHGGSLAAAIKRQPNGCLGYKDSALVLQQCLDGVAYLHSQNVTHRDIKVGNVLVRSLNPMDVALGDFGWSLKSSTSLHTQRPGTPFLRAPETFSDKSPGPYAGDKVDIWALGVMGLQCLVGLAPSDLYEGDEKKHARLLSHMAVRFFEGRPQSRFFELIQSMLCPSPKERPTAEGCLAPWWIPAIVDEADAEAGRFERPDWRSDWTAPDDTPAQSMAPPSATSTVLFQQALRGQV